MQSKYKILSPKWSSNGKQITYTAYDNKSRAAIVIQTLATGKPQLITPFKKYNGTPSFSPDGRKLAITQSKNSNPEIYIVDLLSHNFKQLTFNKAIDFESSWSPNGTHIIFTSDRSGRQQIYRISVNGGQANASVFAVDQIQVRLIPLMEKRL